MDSRMYPQGTGTVKSKYVAGVLTFLSGKISFGNVSLNVVKTKRQVITLAQWNAGVTILAAPGAGLAYRLISSRFIPVGGAAVALTTADILATQSASGVKLVTAAAAPLTENTILKDGATGGVVLAAGASYAANDANTAITASVTGSDLTTSTSIDLEFTYVLEAAV